MLNTLNFETSTSTLGHPVQVKISRVLMSIVTHRVLLVQVYQKVNKFPLSWLHLVDTVIICSFFFSSELSSSSSFSFGLCSLFPPFSRDQLQLASSLAVWLSLVDDALMAIFLAFFILVALLMRSWFVVNCSLELIHFNLNGNAKSTSTILKPF